MKSEKTILMDPTAELEPVEREPMPRPTSLEGKTIGLLDISKARGDVFLARLGELLADKGLSFKSYKKPTFARVVPLELVQRITAESDVLIEALAD